MSVSLLPSNATPFELAAEKSLSRNIDFNISDVWDVEQVDETFLPYLAWGLGVEIWPRNAAEQRAIIVDYLKIRRHRGTLGAIRTAYKALGLDINIEENAPTPSDPRGAYTFKVEIIGQNIDRKLYRELIRLTNLLKPIRCHYFTEVKTAFNSALKMYSLQRLTTVVKLSGEVKNG